MVAAYLFGTTIAVPEGEDVGGTFQSTPLCRAAEQTGCLVTYSSWRDREPPDSDARFGDTGDPITTPYYSMPDFVQGECVDRDGHQYLEISVMADPEDPRADDFNGDFRGGIGWGLHLVDVSLAIGNLIELAESQGAAWLAAQD